MTRRSFTNGRKLEIVAIVRERKTNGEKLSEIAKDVIKLSHGLSIAWDGRVLQHCTSVTDTGVKNHVYAMFTSKSKAKSLG
jgi:hypothetical protein